MLYVGPISGIIMMIAMSRMSKVELDMKVNMTAMTHLPVVWAKNNHLSRRPRAGCGIPTLSASGVVSAAASEPPQVISEGPLLAVGAAGRVKWMAPIM